jgi:phage tail protein X
MDYTQYIVQDGDRWDEIAYRYLGDATNVTPIIEANPIIPIRATLEEGMVLFIPIFDPQPLQGFNNLPPWRKPQG